MTKKSKTSKQNDKDDRPFRFQTLHERLNNININVVHRIRYHDNLTDFPTNDDLIGTSHFHQSLEHWSTLNFSEIYSKLYQQLLPLASSLEQVVYNREQIVTLLRQSLNEHNSLIIETLLDLIVQLARDLQSDFYIYYKEYLFVDIINLLSQQQQQQNEMNTQLLEQVFQCLTYLFKYLWRIMLKDLANLYELYSKYLFSLSSLTTNSEYIRSFAAESFAYLLRKIENYQSFIDYLYNRQDINQDELDSLTLVFAETCKNVQSTFHSCTKSLLICLFKKFLEKPKILQSSIHRIYLLLIEHTNKQHVQILWNCFMDIYRTINHEQSIDSLIYQTFYQIFQLFIEHKMIMDWKEFLTIIKENKNEEFLKIHYETVQKLMKHITINKDILDIYYRFINQTSSNLLYQQTRIIFENDLYKKLPNEFSITLWNYLLNQTNNQQDIINYFVDFILIQRKKSNLIFYLNDNDESILEKINLLNNKTSHYLIQEQITNQGLKFIENFIENTLSIIDNTENFLNGQLWRALILLHSLSNKHFIITNEHLNKLSSIILKNSSIISAITLLELISHSHLFLTPFWYSILEQNYQSEYYLLCTRISFLLNKPNNNYSDQFIDLLKLNLSSFNSNIRLLTLYILSSFLSDINHVLYHCLLCEQSPLNVYEYRSKIIHLQKLSIDFILLNNHSSLFHLSMYYLLGLLSTNFTPLWTITIELLGSYGNKAIEYIGHTYFWSILNEKFQLIKQKENQTMKIFEQINDELINKYLNNNNDDELNNQIIDYIQYRINLFHILNYFPHECEQKTKIIFPIIFDFFFNEYYDHLLSLGLIDKYKSSYQIERLTSIRLSKKFSIKTLESILNLLKQFHHSQQWFEPERIYYFYIHLLLSSDITIQQLAYQCLLTCYQIPQSIIKQDFLIYSEKLLPIFNPSTNRKIFHELIQGVLLDDNISNSIKQQYAFILIRILYSKLNTKRSLSSTTRGRKNFLELNQKYLFQFLITFASNHLYYQSFHYFIQLLLEPFAHELFSTNNYSDYLNIFQKKISLNIQENFHLNSYEIFLKYIQRSLLLLKTFIFKLRIYIYQDIDYIIKFYILTIKFIDYLTNQDDHSIEGKKIRNLLKRIRSISYKSLQIIFQLFDHEDKQIFQNELIDHIWLYCIKDNYLNDLLNKNKQREDIVHMIKLVLIWSSSTTLKNQIFDQRNDAKDLIKCFINLLNENITYDNKQLIIQFIWNIMQINPDDPLISPYNDQLLAYLTRVSSSMIESTNSITLSSKEFDILLILSSKQINNDQIEQLCSIFFRLLRQNILSKKKKKKFSEENLNISILKVLQNLILNIENSIEKYLYLLPILCLKIIQRDQRIELIKLFQIFINQSTNNNQINTIWYLKQLIELNSWNSEQIDEPDYQRRLNSYKEITTKQNINEDKPEYLCLFYHCLYELHYSINDLSLREYASQCIHLFVEKIPLYQTYFLTEIRLILKQTLISSNIREEFLRHLSYLIDINENNEDLNDLKRLRHINDIEIDFFHNLTHVQIHRRYRALKRLKLIHQEENFHLTTINNYLLPIICSFINDVINNEIQDIQDDIVFICLTNFCQLLPWIKYYQLFISYFRQLITKKNLFNLIQKRCLTKTLSSIIDGFHFQLNNNENERIHRTIQQRLLPMILNLLSENSFSIDNLTKYGISTKNLTIDDQRQQAVHLTITFSLIAIKLIVIFPHEFIEQHISTILLHLITLLRSRIYSIRDQARDCLCKSIIILGKRYLKYIIEELITNLKRGYQHFILLHTINTILIHISTLTYDFNIDSIIKIIIHLFIDDYFNLEKTESSKANEHENSSYKPSNIPEAKTNKTLNIMELCGRLIHSNNDLFLCIEPIRQQLLVNNDSKQISKCEKCLQRFQIGLINNIYLTNEILFTFIYHLLTKTEENSFNEQINNHQNKIFNERNTYYLIPAEPKRGHTRVAQTIKYTKKTNIHCLISWTLNLLYKLIKKCKTNDENFLSMIDPFIKHIEICLNSQYIDVIIASLRNLSSLLEYSFPSLTKERITNIYKKIFHLIKIYSSIIDTNDLNDLLTLSYKILGIFIQRSINDNIQLTTEEYQCLFTYIETDFLNLHRQSSAFILLRSIMRYSITIISSDKILRKELDNLLRTRLIYLIVQSPYEHIRTTCRDLFHIYLFSYEHTKTKLKSYFDFFLLQLDYENFQGRLSILLFLQNLFHDLTKQRLNDYAAYFFLPLSCHYYNEINHECKKQFQINLHLLLEKIDQQHRHDILKNIVFHWINDQIEHRCLALQLFIIFIQIEHEQFDQYLFDILDFIQREFHSIENNNNNDQQEKFYDQYIYHLINNLIYIIKYCSNSLQMIQLRLKWLELLKIIDEKCLLHEHLWIRYISTQLFGLLFDMNKPEDIIQNLNKYLIEENNSNTNLNSNCKRLKKSNLDQETLFLHYIITFDLSISPLKKIQRLCFCSCSQLKPSGLTEEFCLQITKNLIYLSKLILLSNSNSIHLIIRRCSRLTTFESTKYPNEITRRSSILKWIAAIVLDLSSLLTNHLKSFLIIIEREIERDETTIHLPLKILAQEVFDIFKRHYDIHLITSIYADIAKQRRTKRLERKQKLAILAINQPEVAYRKKRVKQTKRLGLGKKKRMKAIENAKKNRRKKVIKKTSEDTDDF